MFPLLILNCWSFNNKVFNYSLKSSANIFLPFTKSPLKSEAFVMYKSFLMDRKHQSQAGNHKVVVAKDGGADVFIIIINQENKHFLIIGNISQ